MATENRSKAVLALKDGFIKGLKTGGFMLRIIMPIYLAVVFLRYTPVIAFLQERLAPAMGLFHLPGEAAVPLVTGIFSDEYGVVAAMAGFGFTAAQVTVIAMVTLCFHTIPLEAAVGRTIGFHPAKYTLYRLVLAVGTGLLVGWLVTALLGGGAPGAEALGGAGQGVIGGADAPAVVTPAGVWLAEGWWRPMLLEMLVGGLAVVWGLVRIIVPLMILVEFMLSYRLAEKLAPRLRWLCRVLGVSDGALLPLLVGLLMGVTYGASTIIEINKREPLSRRDMALIGIFLYACHGIIETTVLFSVAGASALFVGPVRLLIAVAVTAAAARLPLFGRD
jgi:hypothetical protein